MPKDYKSRSHHTNSSHIQIPLSKGLNILFLIVFVIATAFFVRSFFNSEQSSVEKTDAPLSQKNKLQEAELIAKKQLQNKTIQALAAKAQSKIGEKIKAPANQDTPVVEPRFDFYTILPEVEVIVSDNEIKTRIKKELVDTPTKEKKYIMQAGSFREFSDAKKLSDKLTKIGVESRIEQAMVDNIVWNRIKIGPFSKLAVVIEIKNRLLNEGMDTLVLKFKE